MTGLDLKLKRVAAGIKLGDVAARMGITHGRLSKIEAQPTVSERLQARYLLALGECQEARVA